MTTVSLTFTSKKDAGRPLDVTEALTPQDLIRYTVPAGGPFITGAPQSNTLTEGHDVLLSPLADIAANTLSDPLTEANVLLFKEVSESKDDQNQQMLPLGVGVVVPHFASTVPDDGWLPVSGGTFNDVDYPELAAAIAAGNKIGADLADGTFRLLDLNGALDDGRGRVLEGLGSQTPGALQNDATAANGLRILKSLVQWDWTAAANNIVSKGANSGLVDDGQALSSTDSQTRAPAVSALWMVRAKPWIHSGTVNISQTVPKYTLTIVAPSGTTTHEVYDNIAYPIKISLTGATKELVPTPSASSGLVTSRTIVNTDGNIIITANASNPSITLTERDKAVVITSGSPKDYVRLANNAEHIFPMLPDIRFKHGNTHRQITARSRSGLASLTITNVWGRWEQTGEAQFSVDSVALVESSDRNLMGRNIDFTAAGAVENIWFEYGGEKYHVQGFVGTSFAVNMITIERM